VTLFVAGILSVPVLAREVMDIEARPSAYLEKTTVQYIGDFEETPQHVTVLGGLGRD